MRRALAFAPLIALAAVVAVGAFVLLRGGERETISEGLIDRPAPAFALQRLDEAGELTNADLAGRAYVVNLFASWCAPCRAEHPHLMALREAGVELVGVAYKDQPQNTARFLSELGDPFSVVALDPVGRFGLDLGLVGVPETFVIGADGRVRAVYRGALTPEVVRDVIMPALREPN